MAAIHQDAAAAGLGEAGHQVEQGALAAARVADQGDELALIDLQVDVLEGDIAAAIIERKLLADIINSEECGHFSGLHWR